VSEDRAGVGAEGGGWTAGGRPAGSGKDWSESDEAARQERACSGWGRGGVGGPLGRPRYSPTNSRSLRASLLRSPPLAWARLLQRPCTRCMRRLTSDYGWADPIYSLFPKINAILRLGTQTNTWCEIIKILLDFYKKDLPNVLFFCKKSSETLVFCSSWVKVAFQVLMKSKNKKTASSA